MAEKQAENEMLPAVVIDDAEDSSLVPVIQIPTYKDTSDKEVMHSVKSIFKSFEPPGTKGASPFKDVDALAQYTMDVMDRIREAREQADGRQMLIRAATLARFWYLGQTIDTELAKGTYGTSAAQKLATAIKKSVPYLYQIRAVAQKLTVTDCYLLGLRGLDTTVLRKLAQVKDDNLRTSIIHAFIDAIGDTSDENRMAQAKKQLKAAINSACGATESDVTTSDPNNGGTEIQVSQEYTKTMKELNGALQILRKLSNEEEIENMCKTLDDFFITDSVPDAEKRLQDIWAKVDEIEKLVPTSIANLKDILEHAKDLKNVDVTPTQAQSDDQS